MQMGYYYYLVNLSGFNCVNDHYCLFRYVIHFDGLSTHMCIMDFATIIQLQYDYS
jgi:hypothetical protein